MKDLCAPPSSVASHQEQLVLLEESKASVLLEPKALALQGHLELQAGEEPVRRVLLVALALPVVHPAELLAAWALQVEAIAALGLLVRMVVQVPLELPAAQEVELQVQVFPTGSPW